MESIRDNEKNPSTENIAATRSPEPPPNKPYIVMGTFLLVGAVTAIGQDQFYRFLNYQPTFIAPITQEWINRISTGFVFLFKVCLSSVVGIAFCFAFWFEVRRKALRLDTIDAMFLVLKNPLKFFNKELILKTRILFVLAAISWLIPLAGIATTGSLEGDSLKTLAHTSNPCGIR
jgi:hypothetical protein